eukprot:CAMPEP_0172700448 /NCGR_PEP_ID=MMETSP1074-20121228/30918_1 /TAXON_ID=2916 /ORGANISM="Ceratium fusus, Strain PA161109" /LENGTH=96 /DNA_ID=CAMNT_0013521823 /DNA_START=174 /DNA_END=460 /DNA_ORIENTATION=-
MPMVTTPLPIQGKLSLWDRFGIRQDAEIIIASAPIVPVQVIGQADVRLLAQKPAATWRVWSTRNIIVNVPVLLCDTTVVWPSIHCASLIRVLLVHT